MKIKKLNGKVVRVVDTSLTSKEVWVELSEPLGFVAGSFVNVFMDINGQRVRRAYSVSSAPSEQNTIALTLRLSPGGVMTPLFWEHNMVGTALELMGPLGLNTADKMLHKKVYLFAFGVGAGVVKSLAAHFVAEGGRELVVVTGSRSEDEILYKDYFDGLAAASKNVSVMHVVSQPAKDSDLPKGYIQDHLSGFNFNNADVYVCGQEAACNALVETVKATNPTDCSFFIEGFH